MEPLRDTVVALTLSDGCSTVTQMSVEYLMVVALILQNLMVDPTVALVRPTGDTVVTQGYPSIPTVSQCDYSIAALLPMLPVGPPGDTVETLGRSPGGHTGTLISIQYLMVAHCYPRVTTIAYGGPLLL